MKNKLFYLCIIVFSVMIMNYDLSLNYKTDLNQSLSELNYQITKNEAVASNDCDLETCAIYPAECRLIVYSNGSAVVCLGYDFWWEI